MLVIIHIMIIASHTWFEFLYVVSILFHAFNHVRHVRPEPHLAREILEGMAESSMDERPEKTGFTPVAQ